MVLVEEDGEGGTTASSAPTFALYVADNALMKVLGGHVDFDKEKGEVSTCASS